MSVDPTRLSPAPAQDPLTAQLFDNNNKLNLDVVSQLLRKEAQKLRTLQEQYDEAGPPSEWNQRAGSHYSLYLTAAAKSFLYTARRIEARGGRINTFPIVHPHSGAPDPTDYLVDLLTREGFIQPEFLEEAGIPVEVPTTSSERLRQYIEHCPDSYDYSFGYENVDKLIDTGADLNLQDPSNPIWYHPIFYTIETHRGPETRGRPASPAYSAVETTEYTDRPVSPVQCPTSPAYEYH